MLRLPEGNGTSSPSLMRSLLNIAKPHWRRHGAVLKPFLLLILAFVLFDVTLRVAARPADPSVRRSVAATFFTKCLVGGLQRMHSSFSDNVNPGATAEVIENTDAPIRLGSAGQGKAVHEPEPDSPQPEQQQPSQPSSAQANAPQEPQPTARNAPDDIITALVREGKCYSDMPEYSGRATLAAAEQSRLLSDATTMASDQGNRNDPDSEEDINILPHEIGALRIAVTNALSKGFLSSDGLVQSTRMLEAMPVAPKPTGPVDPAKHNPWGADRLQEQQAKEAAAEGPRYRTVEEPLTESQAQRLREQLRDVWTKVSARIDPQSSSDANAVPEVAPPRVDWRRFSEHALQQFTSKHELSLGNVMDIRAAKRSFDYERAQGHSERRQKALLIELICLTGRSGDLPCDLLPEAWKPDSDAARPRRADYPQNEDAYSLAMDDWSRTHPCSAHEPLPPALRKSLEAQATAVEDRLFRAEWNGRVKNSPVRGIPVSDPEALLKSQMEAIAAAAGAQDSSTLAELVRTLLPRGRSLRHGLSVYTYPDNKAPMEAWCTRLASKPDAYWFEMLAPRPQKPEVRIVKLNESEKDLDGKVPDPKWAKVLQFDQTYYNVVFAPPGTTDGPTLHYLYWTGSSWQMLGEFWHAFDRPKPARK